MDDEDVAAAVQDSDAVGVGDEDVAVAGEDIAVAGQDLELLTGRPSPPHNAAARDVSPSASAGCCYHMLVYQSFQ